MINSCTVINNIEKTWHMIMKLCGKVEERQKCNTQCKCKDKNITGDFKTE